MIQDARWQLSTAQAITSATAHSTNSVDIGPILRDVGNNYLLCVTFQVTETFVVNADSPLLRFGMTLDASDSAPGTLFTVIGSTGVFSPSNAASANDLTINFHIPCVINPLSDSQRAFMQVTKALGFPLRYLWARYEVTGGTFSAGKVSAVLSADSNSRVPINLYADTAP